MTPTFLPNLDDPRLEPYRNLKDREIARLGGRFIAEGEHIVRRLLASGLAIDSVLLSERRAAEWMAVIPDGVPVLVVPEESIERVIGFAFHSGVLACAFRPSERRLEDLLSPSGDRSTPLTLVICPEIINTDNMGSLIRISSAFGVDAMIVGERSCDPYWRRAVRVSMGTIFRLPIVRSDDLLRDLYRLREEWGVTLAATVLDDAALPLDKAVRPGASRPGAPDRLGLLFGSESQGLHPRWLTACDQLITIPMKLGTDSLNVSVAAAVFLYHFTRSPA